jgi:actin-related protein
MDLRKILFQNIVLSGGSTLYRVIAPYISIPTNNLCSKIKNQNALSIPQGFGDRLLSEMRKLAPKDVKIKVRGSFVLSLLRTVPNN